MKMSDKLTLMVIALGMCIVWFFASFVLMHGGHMTSSGVALLFSAMCMTAFIITFAVEK
jgi:ABC-type uncharacterized transport system permease subunit